MSNVPPPGRKRDPLTKSAPCVSASTNTGISRGSVEPSASSITMISPVAGAKGRALARSVLLHETDAWQQPASHVSGSVRGLAVDEDHFVDAARDQRKNVWQVPGFIQRRDDDADSIHVL